MQLAGGGELGVAEDFAEAIDFRFGRANQMHVEAKADRIELVAHFGDVAAESLDAFNSQLAFGLHRAAGDGGRGHGWKLIDAGQHVVDLVHFFRMIQPLAIMPRLLPAFGAARRGGTKRRGGGR